MGVHKSIPFNAPPMSVIFEISLTEVEILFVGVAIENFDVGASRSSAFAHSSMRLPAGLDVTLV
jgi:hypothetical protein